MKNKLLSLAIAGFFSTQAWATDIIINSTGLNYSPDYTKIELTEPVVTVKKSNDDTTLQEMPIDKFVSLWDKTEAPNSFDKNQPNAILSILDGKGNSAESTFIIHDVAQAKKDSKGSGKSLILNVEYLTKVDKNITEVSINNQPAQLSDLDKVVSGAKEISATILVDCSNPFDGRCR